MRYLACFLVLIVGCGAMGDPEAGRTVDSGQFRSGIYAGSGTCFWSESERPSGYFDDGIWPDELHFQIDESGNVVANDGQILEVGATYNDVFGGSVIQEEVTAFSRTSEAFTITLEYQSTSDDRQYERRGSAVVQFDDLGATYQKTSSWVATYTDGRIVMGSQDCFGTLAR